MKKAVTFIVSLSCVMAVMISLVPSSFAVTDRFAESMKLSGKPCAEDVCATGDDKKITMPDDNEYLDEYLWAFIDAPYGRGAYVYQDPCTEYLSQQGVVSHRSRIAVLAIHNSYYCLIRYYNGDNVVRTGWIPIKFISEEYPKKPFYSGYNFEYTGTYWKMDSEFGKMSENCFPDSDVNYVEFGSVPKILGMKIRYTITDANGVDDPAGKYKLYLYDNGNWYGSSVFDVNNVNEPVDVTVHCVSPQKINRIAVLPVEKEKQGALFELYAVDILVDNEDFFY